jgi:hypothetical protein
VVAFDPPNRDVPELSIVLNTNNDDDPAPTPGTSLRVQKLIRNCYHLGFESNAKDRISKKLKCLEPNTPVRYIFKQKCLQMMRGFLAQNTEMTDKKHGLKFVELGSDFCIDNNLVLLPMTSVKFGPENASKNN